MKQLSLLVISFLISAGLHAQQFRQVKASSLILRQKPSQKSPAIDVLLKKHVLLLIDSGGTRATIDGIHGNWVRAVSVESEKEGFVFDGYLEPVPLIGFRDFTWMTAHPRHVTFGSQRIGLTTIANSLRNTPIA